MKPNYIIVGPLKEIEGNLDRIVCHTGDILVKLSPKGESIVYVASWIYSGGFFYPILFNLSDARAKNPRGNTNTPEIQDIRYDTKVDDWSLGMLCQVCKSKHKVLQNIGSIFTIVDELIG